MKLEGQLPTPTMTATILPSGDVVIHEGLWKYRVKRREVVKRRGEHTCSRCGTLGHNSANRNCPARTAP